MPGPADTIWTWPDAVVAAMLAVCLVATSVLLTARFAGPARRATAVGPAVAGALVVAMAVTLLTHGDTMARVVVAAVVLGAAVAAATLQPRPPRTPPERERREIHNEIAPPDPRC